MNQRSTLRVVFILTVFLAGLVFWWIRSSSVYRPVLLHPGESAQSSAEIEKELIYRIHLPKDHLLGISFDTGSSSVALSLRQPDGQSLRKIPCSYYKDSHRITEITTQKGDYSIFVQGCNEEESGSFELSISASPVSEQDRWRVRVDRLVMEADILVSEYHEEKRREARRKYKEAFQISIDARDRIEQSRILTKLGEISLEMGATSDASDFLNRALAVSGKEKSQQQTRILMNLAEVSRKEGDAETARSYALQALQIAQVSSDEVIQAKGLLVLGKIIYDIGNHGDAIDIFNQSLALWRQLENPKGIAQALLNLAYCHSDLTEISKSSDELDEALRLFRITGDRQGQTYSLVALGHLHALTDDKQKALDCYNQAQEFLKGSEDSMAQGQLYAGKGFIYEEFGDYPKTLQFWKMAIENYKESEHHIAEAIGIGRLGEIYFLMGDHQMALQMLEKCLDSAHKLKHERYYANVLRNMAIVYESTGDILKAMKCLNQALDLNRKVVDRRQEAYTLMSIGHIYESQGDILRALDYYQQAIQLNRDTEDRFGEIANLYRIGYCQLRLDNLSEALDTVRQSVELIEKLRAGVASYGLRTSYFGSIHQHYDLYIDILMHMHRKEDALAVSECARARTLLENIADVSLQSMDNSEPELMEKAKIINAQLDAKIEKYTQLLSEEADGDSRKSLSQEIGRLTAEYEEVQGKIRQNNPRYASLVKPETLSLVQIQQELLDDDSLLLEYLLGEENSYLWAVTREKFSSYVLESNGSEIREKVRRLRMLMTARSELAGEKDYALRVKAAEEEEYPKAAAELSRILLGPVRDLLGSRRLVIVADGALQYLPFGALPTPQTAQTSSPEPLLVDHEIVNLPSASTLAVIRREAEKRGNPDRTLAVFADPVFQMDDVRVSQSLRNPAAPAEEIPGSKYLSPRSAEIKIESSPGSRQSDAGIDFSRLKSTRKEAEAILDMVREKSRMAAIGFEATKSAAMSPELRRYRIVHFATHARIEDNSPELSSLVLCLVDEQGNPLDGHLRLRDIYSLNLSAELVVLSACETALGEEVEGEGLISMVRGFMYSGTPRVLASLWEVDDLATAELMEEFYRQMLQNKQSPAAALRLAQKAQLNKKSRKAPYYWAGFQLQGDWN